METHLVQITISAFQTSSNSRHGATSGYGIDEQSVDTRIINHLGTVLSKRLLTITNVLKYSDAHIL